MLILYFVGPRPHLLKSFIHLQTLKLHHLDIRPRRSFIKFANACKFTTFFILCRHVSTSAEDTTFQSNRPDSPCKLSLSAKLILGTNVKRQNVRVSQFGVCKVYLILDQARGNLSPPAANIETNQSFIPSLVWPKHRN